MNKKSELNKYLLWTLLLVGILFSAILISLPLLAMNKNIILPYIHDDFAIACFKQPVIWQGYEYLIGVGYLISFFIAVFIIKRKQIFNGAVTLFLSTALCLFFYLKVVVPKIEEYSQAPAINFYKSISGQDVYVTTIGFYSYAPYFYFQKKPGGNMYNDNEDWLLNGDIDKPVYFVTVLHKEYVFNNHPDCRFIKQEGGFLFYCRMPRSLK
jgi:hypothetical protein